MQLLYLFAITVGLGVIYVVLLFFLPALFNLPRRAWRAIDLWPIGPIIIVSLFGYLVASFMPDLEVSNRFIHGFGGGFMATLVCFFAVRVSQLGLNRFQFFFIAALIVSTLGVGNEVLEFFLQKYTTLPFAQSIDDTWLDLVSNTVGLLIGLAIFTPFVKASQKQG